MPTATQSAGSLNLAFRRGDEFRRVVTLPGLDLTGYALSAEIYSLTSSTIVLTVSLTFSTPPHAVSIVLSEAQTGLLQAGNYGFRAIWIATGSIQRTFLEGVVEVSR
ncbi:hypothetical protein UFOVP1124_36 [uncultured Caudovirales phage]|uniref:Uncharacterized protein n=1 Tax=uncultured Caudovirales phage TaxID=2100421 RepID=A0A6J5QJF9_9CAUD|nr:hypothetical protein UFOVP1124_36 [uncultured Caudovirales phage]